MREVGPSIHREDNEGQKKLHRAAQEEDEKLVRRLLKDKANVIAKDNDGRTVLHLAPRRSMTESYGCY